MGQREWKAWPADWKPRYNASNEPCDMAMGACACGAWHEFTDEPTSELQDRPVWQILKEGTRGPA